MATKKTVIVVNDEIAAQAAKELTVLAPITKLMAAPIVGVQNGFDIPKHLLPKEMQGVDFEILETGFLPSVKWGKFGEFVAGVYEGVKDEVGPNNSKLYNFDAKGKKFTVWGTTTLDRVFDSGQVAPGDMVMITYVGDLPTDKQPCKLFDVRKAISHKKK